MPGTLGDVTKSVFLKEVENHKLHQEFTVETGNTVYKGQPVKLASGGTIVPAAADEVEINVIGHSIMDGAADESVTIGARGYAIIWAEAEAAIVAGPVKYAGYNTGTNYNKYDDNTVTQANATAWALDNAAAQGDIIRVMIKN